MPDGESFRLRTIAYCKEVIDELKKVENGSNSKKITQRTLRRLYQRHFPEEHAKHHERRGEKKK